MSVDSPIPECVPPGLFPGGIFFQGGKIVRYVEACECDKWLLSIWKKSDGEFLGDIPFR